MLKARRKVKLSILFLYIFCHISFILRLPASERSVMGPSSGEPSGHFCLSFSLVISGARLALSVYLACGLWWTVMGFHHI